jgi:thiol-disulfide isomerase/thioredoxin
VEKIKNYFSEYFRKSSKFKIFSDLVFYLLIIAVLVPWSRTFLIRSILIKPGFKEESEIVRLKPEDYNLILEDQNGKIVNLADHRGEFIFISFWATWCPPCRAELPSIFNLYELYGDRISFFLVTTEDSRKVKEFIDENGYDLPVYFQKSSGSDLLNATSYPTTYIISKEAEILVKKKGAAKWDSRGVKNRIDELLRQQQVQ